LPRKALGRKDKNGSLRNSTLKPKKEGEERGQRLWGVNARRRRVSSLGGESRNIQPKQHKQLGIVGYNPSQENFHMGGPQTKAKLT